MSTPDRIAVYVEKLDGISYFDWLKLRHSIDRLFEKQKNEQERYLQLVVAKKPENITQSLSE